MSGNDVGRRSATVLAAIALALASLVLLGSPSRAAGSPETDLFNQTNSSRTQNGLPALSLDSGASNVARAWSQRMAAEASLYHNPNLTQQVNQQVTTQWTRLGENVGVGNDVNSLQSAFMNSSAHRSNILGDYNRLGVGTATSSDGRLWVTTIFIKGPALSGGGTVPSVVNDALGTGGTSSANNRIDLVDRAADGSVRIRAWNGSGWGAPTNLGGGTNADPDDASWAEGRLDVFITGTDGALWHRGYGGSWGGWERLGGSLIGSPTAVSWGPNRIDVFARGTDNALWSINWNGSRWSGWYSLSGGLLTSPEVASWGPNRLDVFAVGPDRQLWHRAWTGSTWGGWEGLGGSLTSAPGAASSAFGRVEAYARGGDGAIWTRGWNGSVWTGWTSLGGSSASAPEAVSRAGGLTDVFVRAGSGGLYQSSFSGGSWGGWAAL